MSSQIKYYPVDNGDQSLISIEENNYTTRILVDCNIRETSKGNDNPEQYDVKVDLLKSLSKKELNGVKDVSYADVFILTHGDEDHLLGFEKNFYQGDPKNYKQANKDNGEIFIDVLWFSPMVMGTATNDDERCFNKEAKRRIKLYCDKSEARKLPGNRIVIVGDDGNEKLEDVEDMVRYDPGEVVTRFNDRNLTSFSIFIHSPYQKDLKDEEVDKNMVSLVFQARFHNSGSKDGFATLAMFGGDANYEAWETILDKTKRHKNDTQQRALDYDIFMAPHHCSWTYFGPTPMKEEDKPAKASLDILDYKRGTAKVIASCKEIKNDDDNPPHYRAKQEYVKKVKDENFLNTATYSKVGKTPQPIIFDITPQGPMKPKKLEGSAGVAGGAALGAINQPSSYG